MKFFDVLVKLIALILCVVVLGITGIIKIIYKYFLKYKPNIKLFFERLYKAIHTYLSA